MADQTPPPSDPADPLLGQVDRKARQRRRGRRKDDRSAWHGLGTMGMVGWSVALPTLLGVLGGVWLDGATAGRVPWTLIGLLGGLGVGCVTAWRWVDREQQEIVREREEAESDE